MAATLEHHFEADRLFLFPAGGWVIEEARKLDQRIGEVFLSLPEPGPRQLVLDLSEVQALDTAGAAAEALLAGTQAFSVLPIHEYRSPA